MSAPAKKAARPAPPRATKPIRSEWHQKVKKLAVNPELDLAPLLGEGDPVVFEGCLRIYPYWLRRDISAVLGWAEQLEEHPKSARVVAAFPGQAPGMTRVSVIGVLEGETVEILAETHLPVPNVAGGVVSWDVLFELAATEAAAFRPAIEDVALSDAELADPLAVTR